MSKTIYITRNARILFALSDDEYSDEFLRCSGSLVNRATYYPERQLDTWEFDALHVFSEYLQDIGLGVDWEYNGSSRCDSSDPEDGWTVAVYESPLSDFDGDQIEALAEHADTVFHGFATFVDKSVAYNSAVVGLADIAAMSADIGPVRAAVNAVYDTARESSDWHSDIDDALRGTEWGYDHSYGEVIRRLKVAA